MSETLVTDKTGSRVTFDNVEDIGISPNNTETIELEKRCQVDEEFQILTVCDCSFATVDHSIVSDTQERFDPENPFISILSNDDSALTCEDLDSTLITEGIYATPLTSPDKYWNDKNPIEGIDVMHECLRRLQVDDKSMNRLDNDDDSFEYENSLNGPCTSLIEENEQTVFPTNLQLEDSQTTPRLENTSVIQQESMPSKNDRSIVDLLLSIVESHREALNDQKVVLTSQTNAINRLATAIEEQTRILTTMRETDL